MSAPFDPLAFLRQKLAEQPLYRKYANTVTSATGFLVGAVWLLISSGIDVPDSITKGTLLAIAALTTLGVLNTPNGVTERQIEELEKYAGDQHGMSGRSAE